MRNYPLAQDCELSGRIPRLETSVLLCKVDLIGMAQLVTTDYSQLVSFRCGLIRVADASKDMIWGNIQRLTGLHKSLLMGQLAI